MSSTEPGVLVLSEIAYPAWQVYVDGQPRHLLTADGLLRAVAVPAGQHVVEWRYESATLALGIGLSVATVAIVSLVLLANVLPGHRRSSRRSHAGERERVSFAV